MGEQQQEVVCCKLINRSESLFEELIRRDRRDEDKHVTRSGDLGETEILAKRRSAKGDTAKVAKRRAHGEPGSGIAGRGMILRRSKRRWCGPHLDGHLVWNASHAIGRYPLGLTS